MLPITSDASLVERPLEATLFRRSAGPISAAAFLCDAHAAAAALPDGQHVINLCRDRYAFAVVFAAALLRGQVCLMSGDLSPGGVAGLAARYPNTVAACDDPVLTLDLPMVLVTPAGRDTGPSSNPAIPAEQLAAIVFTSGSTGTPVPHRKHWGALAERSRAAGLRFGLHEAEPSTVIGTVPPHHMYGLETTVLLPLHAAASSWCGRAFFPGDVRAALAMVPAPRILVTTPLQLRGLQDVALPDLQSCISATAPLDPALALAAEMRWHAPVLEIFGATEAGSIASRRTTDGDGWTLYPGIHLTHGTDATAVHAPGAGLVELSDQLEPMAGGFRLLGRRSDIVKLGGRRASLSGLNSILTALDGVADGTFVVPDDVDQRSTARLMAVVVAPSRTTPGILADLRQRIDPVFLPRRVVQVDALPRNELGKLPRQALLALLARA